MNRVKPPPHGKYKFKHLEGSDSAPSAEVVSKHQVVHKSWCSCRDEAPNLAQLRDRPESSALLALLLGHTVVGYAYILLGWMVPSDSPC